MKEAGAPGSIAQHCRHPYHQSRVVCAQWYTPSSSMGFECLVKASQSCAVTDEPNQHCHWGSLGSTCIFVPAHRKPATQSCYYESFSSHAARTAAIDQNDCSARHQSWRSYRAKRRRVQSQASFPNHRPVSRSTQHELFRSGRTCLGSCLAHQLDARRVLTNSKSHAQQTHSLYAILRSAKLDSLVMRLPPDAAFRSWTSRDSEVVPSCLSLHHA